MSAYHTNRVRDFRLIMLCFGPFLLLGPKAEAQDRRWRDPVNGSFADSLKWVGGVVPNSSSTAVFGLNAGPNPFTITFAGPVTNAGLKVRNQGPILDLAGFSYTINGQVLIGDTAAQTGSLRFANGGVTCGDTLLGTVAGATGNLTLDNPAAFWTSSGEIRVGEAGNGAFTVSAAVPITATNGLIVGNSGQGAFSLSAGGTVTTPWLNVGRNAGGTGQLALSDLGTTVTVPGDFNVGYQGQGTFQVSNGAALSASSMRVGSATGSSGSATVTGANSAISISAGNLWVGLNGYGRLDILGGGTVSSIQGFLGDGASGVGQVTIDGAGSRWDITGWCAVGFRGAGVLTLSNGGVMALANQSMTIGFESTGVGDVVVTGAGSTITGIQELSCGGWNNESTVSNGSLTIEDGGTVNCSGLARIGCLRTSFGTGQGVVTVRGPGSRWDVGEYLYVGYFGGDGSVDISDGATLNTRGAVVAQLAEAEAHVSVRGSQTKWFNAEEIRFERAAGSLSITDGARVQSNAISVHSSTEDHEAMIVDGAGSLLSTSLWSGLGIGSNARAVVRNGGAIEVGGLGVGAVSPDSPELVIDGQASYVYAAGRVDVGGYNPPNTMTGTITLLNGGTLICDDYVNMMVGSRLVGTGYLDGGVSSRGTVSPGQPLGVLNISRGYNQQWNGTLEIEIAGSRTGVDYDVLNVSDTQLDGRLRVTLRNGYMPITGQVFDILNHSGWRQGVFAQVEGAQVAPGLAFVVTYPPNKVQLVVDGVEALNPSLTSMDVYLGFTEPIRVTAQTALHGDVDVTSSVTWMIDDSQIATVSPDGMVNGLAAGATVLRAQFAGFEIAVPLTVHPLSPAPGTAQGLVARYFDFWRPPFETMTPTMSETRASIDVPADGNGQGFGNSSLSGCSGSAGIGV